MDMTPEEIRELINTDQFVQNLIAAPIPARLAYIGVDGAPRVVPVSYLWDGEHFVFASPPDWYKIKSMMANPKIAFTVDETVFPPTSFAIRGIASIEFDMGLPEEYVEASRRIVGEEKMPDWERAVRAENRNMALVRITPTWIKVVDFVTRYPGPTPS